MSKTDDIRKEMTSALKAGDKPRKEALSLLLSALKNKEIDKRAPLTDEEAYAIIFKEIKEAKETIEASPKDRKDIIEECSTRIAVYSEFVPKLMDEEEIREVVLNTLKELSIEKPTAADKGKIMRVLMPKVKGKADGKLVNEIVTELFK